MNGMGEYDMVTAALAVACAAVLGLTVALLRTRRRWRTAVGERGWLLERERATAAQNAVGAERARIARELHDIVAHHLTVVVIQAQGAQRAAARDPARARDAMADVERTGRTALDEMRHLLGLLRTGEPADETAYLPPFGLADIDDLAEGMRGAGLPVTVLRRGEPRDVPEDIGLTAYRIVQESLTNVLKHAGPATATVELEFATELGVTVTDDGRGASADLGAVPGARRGTTGLRERVAALGGKLSMGPRPGGGYRVHATIPLEQA
jgi:signal transduction histidine kinase